MKKRQNRIIYCVAIAISIAIAGTTGIVFGATPAPVAAVVPAAAATPAPAYQDRECLSCHSATINSQKLKRSILPISSDTFKETPHNKLHCVDCHNTARLADKPKRHMTAISEVDCGQCHYKGNTKGAPNLDVTKEYKRGIHGTQTLGAHNPDTPKCKDCHGFHEIRRPSDPKSAVSPLHAFQTCGRCHGNVAMMKKYKLSTDIFTRYKDSVHGRGLINMGLIVTASCPACHGAHDIRPPKDLASSMNRKNIPKTCAKCHLGIYVIYRDSIHGAQWAKGNKDVPVCTDCHGEHNIAAPSSISSPVNPENIANTCARCHESVPIAKKYALPGNRLSSFESSFHGTALKLNSLTVANCASCHSSHNILPASDPRSTVNPKNLSRTCGKCHPEAKKNNFIGKVHVSPSPTESKIIFYVRLLYMLMIGGSVLGFLFYIGVDIYGHLRRKRKKKNSA